MKLLKIKFVVLLGLIFASNVFAAEYTESKSLDTIQIGTNMIFFKNESGWGAASCPSAKYIYVRSDRAWANLFLQLGLEAKSNPGLELKAEGNCDANGHFEIEYLILAD